MRIATLVGLMLLPTMSVAHATVYGWHDDQGALHLTNQADEVPRAVATDVQSFTAPPRAIYYPTWHRHVAWRGAGVEPWYPHAVEH